MEVKEMRKEIKTGLLGGVLSGVIAGGTTLSFLLYLMKPNHKRDISDFRGKMYAHRGLHGIVDGKWIPENSLVAFRKAKEHNLSVELDVQMTKDRQLVVFHDNNLRRMCGVYAKVKDLTYEELCQYPLKHSKEKIPLLKEVLKVLDHMDIICEIKNHNGNKNDEFCRLVYDQISSYQGCVCVESFSPFLMHWFYINHPEIIRGQLSNRMSSREGAFFPVNFIMSHLLINRISKPDFIAYKFSDTKTFGYRLCKKMYQPFCVAWTVRGDEEISHAKKEFDTLIFELGHKKRHKN